MGGAAIDHCGYPLPAETLKVVMMLMRFCLASVGGPKWTNLPPDQQPERGLHYYHCVNISNYSAIFARYPL